MTKKFLLPFLIAVILTPYLVEESHCQSPKPRSEPSKELVETYLDQKTYYKLKHSERTQLHKELQKDSSHSIDYLVSQMGALDEARGKRALQLLLTLAYSKNATFSDQSVGAIVKLATLEEDPRLLEQLLRVLSVIGPRTKAVEATIYDIIDTNRNPSVRRSAVEALGKVNSFDGAEHAKAERLFLKLLKSDAPSIRAAAAKGLGSFNSESQEVMDALIDAMDDNYFKVRSAALYSMRIYGPEAEKAVPKIIELARTETGEGIVPYSFHALRSIGGNNPAVVDLYIEFLQDDDQYMSALSHISGLGGHASRLTPYVEKFLTSSNPKERFYAASALGEIGSVEQVAILKKALKDSDKRVKGACLKSIEKIKQRSKFGF